MNMARSNKYHAVRRNGQTIEALSRSSQLDGSTQRPLIILFTVLGFGESAVVTCDQVVVSEVDQVDRTLAPRASKDRCRDRCFSLQERTICTTGSEDFGAVCPASTVPRNTLIAV